MVNCRNNYNRDECSQTMVDIARQGDYCRDGHCDWCKHGRQSVG